MMGWCHTSVVCIVLLVTSGLRAEEDVTRKDADACEPDVHRLCQTFFPDTARVAQCLVDRRADLSPACAEALARPRDEHQVEEQKAGDQKTGIPKTEAPKAEAPESDITK